MPFPKDVRDAAGVANELKGAPLEQYQGVPLMLESYEEEASAKFGQLCTMYCKTEDGEDVKLSTFSEVVASQLHRVEDHLPLIITPRKESNYYVIY